MKFGYSISEWRRKCVPLLLSPWLMVIWIEHSSPWVHTPSSLRGSQYEVPVEVAFLKPGAFVEQSVATYPKVRAIRRLGRLKAVEFNLVFAALLRWLGHD